ncbi:MAG: CBS domain-containing protein, partial [Chloroflexi bacterium]|nr:CBS domain-containing protein [Chloroflexota bacterium]
VGLEEAGYPPVRGILLRDQRHDVFIPIRCIQSLDLEKVILTVDQLPLEDFERHDGEVLLEHDIIDRQLIDVHGARVVRANDAELAERGKRLSLVAIDASAGGLLRRLVPRRIASGIEGNLLDWAVVEPLASEVPDVRLHITHDKLAKLHPSDIARIIDSLAVKQGEEILRSLDNALAADTLEEIEEDHQAGILERLPPERAADLLEEMAPDAAADLLDDLPPEHAADLIEHMEAEESSDVSLLLTYPEHSVGGLMTTDVPVVPAGLSVAQAVERLRASDLWDDLRAYIFVTDAEDPAKLRGVVTLPQLLVAQGQQPIEEFMHRDVRIVHSTEPAIEAVRILTEYNLLAVPVVDEQGRLIGMVTADDALEYLLPEQYKRHSSRFLSR